MDTSAIYSIRTRHYPPDVFKSLNVAIERAAADGTVCVIPQVLDEIASHATNPNRDSPNQAPAIHDWAKSIFNLSQTQYTQRDHVAVLRLAQVIRDAHQDWFESATVADPYVIAEAEVLGCAVVSTENPHFELRDGRIQAIDGRSQFKNAAHRYSTKVNIPDVCLHRGVHHMNLLEFFRSQRWRF